MRIAILPSWYKNNRSDFAGIFVRDQAIALQNATLDITILYADLDIRNVFHQSLFQNLKIDTSNEFGIKTFRLNGFFFPKWNNWLVEKWSFYYQKLYECYSTEIGVPDLIHAHSYFAGKVALDLKKKYGIPYVITEHHSGFVDSRIPKWQYPIISDVLDNADAIVAVSEDLKLRLKKFTAKNIAVIPNLVDGQIFQPSVANYTEKIKMICVAGLTERKGQSELIDAFYHTIKKYPNIQLTLVGDGDQRNVLLKKVGKLKLEKHIFFTGSIDKASVNDLLVKSNFFVLASKSENLPVAIIEAQCCGLPILATNVGGVKELISEKNGILIPPDDKNALKIGLEKMILNHQYFDKSAIRNNAIANYGSDIIANKIVTIYKSILKNA
jgi:L-malate glycosyltransferase